MFNTTISDKWIYIIHGLILCIIISVWYFKRRSKKVCRLERLITKYVEDSYPDKYAGEHLKAEVYNIANYMMTKLGENMFSDMLKERNLVELLLLHIIRQCDRERNGNYFPAPSGSIDNGEHEEDSNSSLAPARSTQNARVGARRSIRIAKKQRNVVPRQNTLKEEGFTSMN